MTDKSTRREFLQSTAGAAAVCAATTIPDGTPAAKAGPQDATSPMVDFDRSFFTWTSKPWVPNPVYIHAGGMVQGAGSVRNVRILYEAKCDITSHATGQVEELFLLHPCRSEYTIPERDFFQLPSGEFRVIFTRTRRIPIAKQPSTEPEDVRPGQLNFAATRFTTRNFSQFSVLSSPQQVIEATLSEQPLNARTTYRDEAAGYTISIEYPVRTINLNVEAGLFQVDTGPVPLPDITSWEGGLPTRCFLTFVGFSRFDSAEFILRREVEPSDEDKQWLHARRGNWRWELRDPSSPPPGHPPRPAWPTVYNETMTLRTTNEILCADV